MRSIFLFLLPIIALGSCAVRRSSPTPSPLWSQQMVESHGLGDFYCNRHYQSLLAETGWDYVSGLVANAVLKAWKQYPEKEEYYQAVKAFADRNLQQDGSMIITSKGESALRKDNIDDLPAGRIFFTLYETELARNNIEEAEKYKKAADLIRHTLKYEHARIPDHLPGAGGFFHKAIYPNQMWLDGLYMGSTIYAEWQHCFGRFDPTDNDASWSDIALQFKTIHHHTYNADMQLNYHGWSATPLDSNAFWSRQVNPFLGTSTEFWGRGMGWYFAALVDVLEFMPHEHPEYNNVLHIYEQVAAGLARWQDKESGLWYQLLQYDASTRADGIGDEVAGHIYNVGQQPNYLESSCSSIFTYAYLKGIRIGLLDKRKYTNVAKKAYNGLVKEFITPQSDGKIDIGQVCASAGLGPYKDLSRTGTINYYLAGKDVSIVQNEGKAIGPFIMASLEYELIKK